MIDNEKEWYDALDLLISNDKVRSELSSEMYKFIKKNFLCSVTAKKIMNDIEKGNKKYEKSTGL
jgi:glycosyltransferase involved in cell wall biosynthesis